jgi:glucose/arabinose dehydrogenase
VNTGGSTSATGTGAGSGGTETGSGGDSGSAGEAGIGGSSGFGGAAGSAGAGGTNERVPGTEGFSCDAAEGEVPTLRLVEVAGGFEDPLLVTFAPGDATRLFVVEQAGTIRIIENGNVVEEPFLDLTASVERDGNEQGLLGLAFHPDYANNGRFFVNYTAKNGVHGVPTSATIVSEFSVSAEPNIADIASERVVLTQDQPERNHNGGTLAWGADGFLYIGFGDGGPGNDPDDQAQNSSTWLGSMLRIDVDASDAGEYGIPSGNMDSPAAPEVFHYGLRNPWRFSFDACTSDLYLGDVGQNDWEELDVVPNGMAHVNFGWKICEGTHLRGTGEPCDREDFMAPVAEYGRGVGQAIVGGHVYRGSLIPALRGTYFYADYVTGAFFSFQYVDGELTNERTLTDELDTSSGAITSFGQDFAGEVYVVRRTGAVQRIEPAP